MPDPLSPETAARRLAVSLPLWEVEDGRLVRMFETGGWRVGSLLHGMIAFLAEAANHHPDVLLTYDRVTVRLVSHDVGGITDRDLELARRIETAVTDEWDPAVFTHAPRAWIR
ncbi:MAG: 4a-hydroxytetrahydrobiopterin dehydratase [Gemmatimonadota bacterium]|jgi:4a-hydroxytetrahydrobiopterin dehydratase|nr:4a-hydroxytetrahydrobiopterin dehydratase [Gemmatimonadota bacterium]